MNNNFADRKDFYLYNRPDKVEETKKRLTEISELDMIEVGYAQFGIKDVMSGLYVEKVWEYSDEDWKSYMDWVRHLKNKKATDSR